MNPKCYYVRMVHAPIGTPDIIACVYGRFVAIEVKDDENGEYRITEAQKMRARKILNADGDFYVIDKHNVFELEGGGLPGKRKGYGNAFATLHLHLLHHRPRLPVFGVGPEPDLRTASGLSAQESR